MAKKRGKRKSGRRRSTGSALTVFRRGRGAVRGALPQIRAGRVLKVSLGLLAGKVLKSKVDLPMVTEEALGLAIVSITSKSKGEKDCIADVALGLQVVDMADQAGVTDRISGLLSAATP